VAAVKQRNLWNVEIKETIRKQYGKAITTGRECEE
jgi:hypothetical protein